MNDFFPIDPAAAAQEAVWTSWLISLGLTVLKLVIVIVAFMFVLSLGKSLIAKSFVRLQSKRNMSAARSQTLEKLATAVLTYFLGFIVIGIVFELFGLDVKTLIAGAGIVGLAIGFGAQGLVSDVVTGFFVLLEKQMDVGDYVSVADHEGIIEEIGLRTTQIRLFDGTLAYIPNREIRSLSNHSRGNMRALVDIGIAYEENIDRAIEVIQRACDQVAAQNNSIKEGPQVLGVQSLGSSDVVIRVLCRTENMQQWSVERSLRKVIKEALDANGIEIPYPHQVNVEKK